MYRTWLLQIVAAPLVLPNYKKTDAVATEDDRVTLKKFKGWLCAGSSSTE